MDHMVFTRDGKLPTESKDEAIIEQKIILKEKLMSNDDGEEYLKNEISKISPKSNFSVTTQILNSGSFQSLGGENDRKNIFFSIIEQ